MGIPVRCERGWRNRGRSGTRAQQGQSWVSTWEDTEVLRPRRPRPRDRYPEAQTDGVSGTARERQAEPQRHRGNRCAGRSAQKEGIERQTYTVRQRWAYLGRENKDPQRETQRGHTHTRTHKSWDAKDRHS